ncbi:MAG: hypothetical protein OXD49_11195 [Candidatus Poribacteria bacterium]|nr:hypothetical protein [Candidatus Poribacteria bacterium]
MKKAGKKSDLKAAHKVIFFTKMADIHHRRLLVRIDSEFSENQERMYKPAYNTTYIETLPERKLFEYIEYSIV